MDLRGLEIFIQAAETNSFTKAAEQLGYSQPTVSFQIKQLEKELGVQLFDRIGHTVTLTDEGRNALTYAQNICRLSSEMASEVGGRCEPGGLVRVAMADSLCEPLVGSKFVDFHAKYPNISVKVMTAGTDEMFRLLDHNEADIVCTLDSHIYNTTYVISREDKVGVHFVCAADSPPAASGAVTIRELATYPFVLTEKGMSYRRLLDEKLAAVSLEIRPVMELGSADVLCRLVEKNIGLSFLPDYVTEEAVRAGRLVRLEVEDFEVELWRQLLYRRDKWLSQKLQVTLKYLADISLDQCGR